ncbi:hypothetical protein [Candidatus Pseudoruminococcus sp.]|uniref:hypothetical protein n=1 Tax=Candidatus Pseudoruminococcus sp. TaxID=3101048 RepID=UPI00399BF534
MKSKKKYIIGSLVIIFCLFITISAAYTNHQKELRLESEAENEKKIEEMKTNILSSLQCHGFPNANIDTRTHTIYINNLKKENIDVVLKDDIVIYDLEKGSDISSILDAVVPAFDKKFRYGDGEIITERLIKNRFHVDENKLHGGFTSYNQIRYEERLDDTETYVDMIMIDIN